MLVTDVGESEVDKDFEMLVILYIKNCHRHECSSLLYRTLQNDCIFCFEHFSRDGQLTQFLRIKNRSIVFLKLK